jgi:hypothetical protein
MRLFQAVISQFTKPGDSASLRRLFAFSVAMSVMAIYRQLTRILTIPVGRRLQGLQWFALRSRDGN